MAVNSDLVYVGSPDRITGAIMSAEKGTTLPTDASTPPDPAFEDSGYITEDGATLADAQTWVDIKDWGGDTVRRIKSESQVTIATSFLEVNGNSAKAAFGENNVTVTGGQIAIKINVKEPTRKSWLVNMLDGDRFLRLVIPDGQVTDRGDMQFTRQGAVVIPVTITAYPDVDGNTVYIYAEADSAVVAATGATAGTPGALTPAGADVPADLAALQGASPAVVASPTTAWATGQNIVLGTGTAYWNGTAWVGGIAP
jgi:hypothetical protein